MSDSPYYLDVTAGNAKNDAEVVHKFGRAVVSTTFIPICFGGIYRTPQIGAATTLRVKAGDVVDTAAGAGAQEITLIGLNASGVEVTETLATAGTSASSNSSHSYIRLYRVFVSKSGTYATVTVGSHDSNIVIENSAGTEDWCVIDSAEIARGQSEMAAYTVPIGKTAYIKAIIASVESNKTATVVICRREGILKTAAPYDAMKILVEIGGTVSGIETIAPSAPFGPFLGGTDIICFGKVAATDAEVDVDLEIILRDNE